MNNNCIKKCENCIFKGCCTNVGEVTDCRYYEDSNIKVGLYLQAIGHLVEDENGVSGPLTDEDIRFALHDIQRRDAAYNNDIMIRQAATMALGIIVMIIQSAIDEVETESNHDDVILKGMMGLIGLLLLITSLKSQNAALNCQPERSLT